MSALSDLQAEITILMDQVTKICKRYRYDAVPTVLLRHSDGAAKSILVSNDSLGLVVMTIAELGEIGNESSMSPREAVLKLFCDDTNNGALRGASASNRKLSPRERREVGSE